MSSKGKSSAETGDRTALVPKLRFPEFEEADGWEEISLQKLARPVTDRATAGDVDNVLSLSGEHGLVLQSEYFGRKIAGDSTDRYLKIRQNDFVYNDRTTKASSFGTIKRLSAYAGGIVSPIYKCFRFQPSENPAFWECYFESGSHDPALAGLVNEGARAGRFNISVTQFLSTNAWRPDQAEQQKIADCLDSADALIEAQGRKVEVLKAHKKGLMQLLFPQEGETQPRLRFPEFERAGEWSQIELGRLIEIKGRIGYRGYTVADIVGPGEGAIALSPSNISEDGSLGFEKATFISWTKYNESPEIMVEKGHTLLVKTGSTYGKSAFVSDLPQECTVNPQIVVLKPISVNPLFLSLLIAGGGVQSKIEANVVGGAIPTLSQDSISKFKVLVPKISEQQRVAECLTSLDDLIVAEKLKLDTLKTHKKGLMQLLFPQVGEHDA